MDQLNEVRSQLRSKRVAYQDLRNDYELLRQNLQANVEAKKSMRLELAELTKEFQRLKKIEENKKPEEFDEINPEIQ